MGMGLELGKPVRTACRERNAGLAVKGAPLSAGSRQQSGKLPAVERVLRVRSTGNARSLLVPMPPSPCVDKQRTTETTMRPRCANPPLFAARSGATRAARRHAVRAMQGGGRSARATSGRYTPSSCRIRRGQMIRESCREIRRADRAARIFRSHRLVRSRWLGHLCDVVASGVAVCLTGYPCVGRARGCVERLARFIARAPHRHAGRGGETGRNSASAIDESDASRRSMLRASRSGRRGNREHEHQRIRRALREPRQVITTTMNTSAPALSRTRRMMKPRPAASGAGSVDPRPIASNCWPPQRSRAASARTPSSAWLLQGAARLWAASTATGSGGAAPPSPGRRREQPRSSQAGAPLQRFRRCRRCRGQPSHFERELDSARGRRSTISCRLRPSCRASRPPRCARSRKRLAGDSSPRSWRHPPRIHCSCRSRRSRDRPPSQKLSSAMVVFSSR